MRASGARCSPKSARLSSPYRDSQPAASARAPEPVASMTILALIQRSVPSSSGMSAPGHAVAIDGEPGRLGRTHQGQVRFSGQHLVYDAQDVRGQIPEVPPRVDRPVGEWEATSQLTEIFGNDSGLRASIGHRDELIDSSAAGIGVIIEQDHTGSRACSTYGGGPAGGSCTDDENVSLEKWRHFGIMPTQSRHAWRIALHQASRRCTRASCHLVRMMPPEAAIAAFERLTGLTGDGARPVRKPAWADRQSPRDPYPSHLPPGAVAARHGLHPI